MTYVKATPIEAAPASPILLYSRSRHCKVLFTLQIRHRHTLIMPNGTLPETTGGAKKMSYE
jgi:hypothetical protein